MTYAEKSNRYKRTALLRFSHFARTGALALLIFGCSDDKPLAPASGPPGSSSAATDDDSQSPAADSAATPAEITPIEHPPDGVSARES